MILDELTIEQAKAQSVELLAKNCNDLSVIRSNMILNDLQDRAVKVLADNGFEYVILKGLSSAAYYPQPMKRTLGDIDILVRKEKFDEADGLLERELHPDEHFIQDLTHTTFTFGTSTLELHKSFNGIPDVKEACRCEAFLEGMMERAVLRNVAGHEFMMPCDADQAMIIFTHAVKHLMDRGIGLRHLCDWGYFMAKTRNEDFWERFAGSLENTGFYKTLLAMSLAAGKALEVQMPEEIQRRIEEAEAENPQRKENGDSLEEETWDIQKITGDLGKEKTGGSGYIRNLADRILADTLAGGNFGNEIKGRHAAYIVTSTEGKDKGIVSGLWHGLKKHARENHELANKNAAGLVVCCVADAFAYIGLVISGKRAGIGEIEKENKERRELFGDLGLI